MRYMKTFIAVSVALVAGFQVAAQDPAPTATAEVAIGLPDDKEPRVAVSNSGSRLVLELPQGAMFPLDIETASGGFLKAARVEPLGNERVRYELLVERGVLHRVEYMPDSVRLTLRSRFVEASPAGRVDDYQLGVGDMLRVTVHNQADLTSTPTVLENGLINVPLIGDVEAIGLSVRGLAVRLAERYEEVLVQPQVDVQIVEHRSQWVTVGGEVAAPRRVILRGGTDLKEALSEAGSFGPDAGEEILITRRPAEGDEPTTEIIDRAAFESGLVNPKLRHGDIITVSPAKYCYISGEVRSAQRIKIERGMTLLKAIAMAGGFTQWANTKRVHVRNEGDEGPGREYNIKAIQAGRVPDPELRGGEVIHVKRRFL